MTTFSETTVKRARSGSFTGHIDDSPQGIKTGYAKFSYSKKSRVFDVKTIASNAKGGGSRMMTQMESLARENSATKMETATSRPGFFQKMGFDYTPQQKQINTLKYKSQELKHHENNRGEESGGGFLMFKPLNNG